MLSDAGHVVEVDIVSNDTIGGLNKAQAFARASYDASNEKKVAARCAAFEPDIVHVHNFWPLLTPAVHVGARSSGAALVQTLHNYRLLCAAATFERGGQVCEDCLHGSKLNAVLHACYRGSRAASLALVRLQQAEAKKATLSSHVDRFICLSQFARNKFEEGGLPKAKLAIKPNFIERAAVLPTEGARRSMLFVGRLSPEKGLRVLVEAWQELPGIPLRIAGDGPLLDELRIDAPPNVFFLGRLDSEQVLDEMRKARALLVPSLWYEGFPMTIVEAFSAGLPVIASRLGALAEIILPGKTGALFDAGSAAALAATVRTLDAAPERLAQMGRDARATYENRYTAQQNLPLLEAIYAGAMAARRA